MPGYLDSIVALHECQTELKEAEALLAGIPDWMQELHDRHSQQKGEIEAARLESEAAEQSRRTAEAAAQDAEQKQLHYQEQIGRVSTQREYGALLKEIDTTKQQISEHEQLALESIERRDALKGQIEELSSSFADLDQEYSEQLAKWEEEKPGVAQRVDDLRQRTQSLRGEIPRPVQSLFDRIDERTGGSPLAQVDMVLAARGNNHTWFCSACSYRARPQLVVQIRNEGSLNQCDSCKRILYIVAEAESAE